MSFFSQVSQLKMEPIGAQIVKISNIFIQPFNNNVKPMAFHFMYSSLETDPHGKILNTFWERTNLQKSPMFLQWDCLMERKSQTDLEMINKSATMRWEKCFSNDFCMKFYLFYLWHKIYFVTKINQEIPKDKKKDQLLMYMQKWVTWKEWKENIQSSCNSLVVEWSVAIALARVRFSVTAFFNFLLHLIINFKINFINESFLLNFLHDL